MEIVGLKYCLLELKTETCFRYKIVNLRSNGYPLDVFI